MFFCFYHKALTVQYDFPGARFECVLFASMNSVFRPEDQFALFIKEIMKFVGLCNQKLCFMRIRVESVENHCVFNAFMKFNLHFI